MPSNPQTHWLYEYYVLLWSGLLGLIWMASSLLGLEWYTIVHAPLYFHILLASGFLLASSMTLYAAHVIHHNPISSSQHEIVIPKRHLINIK
jgi:hypothetical protein